MVHQFLNSIEGTAREGIVAKDETQLYCELTAQFHCKNKIQ